MQTAENDAGWSDDTSVPEGVQRQLDDLDRARGQALASGSRYVVTGDFNGIPGKAATAMGCTCGLAWEGHPNPHSITCPMHRVIPPGKTEEPS